MRTLTWVARLFSLRTSISTFFMPPFAHHVRYPSRSDATPKQWSAEASTSTVCFRTSETSSVCGADCVCMAVRRAWRCARPARSLGRWHSRPLLSSRVQSGCGRCRPRSRTPLASAAPCAGRTWHYSPETCDDLAVPPSAPCDSGATVQNRTTHTDECTSMSLTRVAYASWTCSPFRTTTSQPTTTTMFQKRSAPGA